MNTMKHTLSVLLTVTVILLALTGCGAVGKQAPGISENEEGTVLTVRIENQSAVNLYSIAVSYSVNGKLLGSKAYDRIDRKADHTVYEFCFVRDELPIVSGDSFQIDVFAAEIAAEDYSDCGSVVIEQPRYGTVYTMLVQGDELSDLVLSTNEDAVTISALNEDES
jgi:hypothetical protein